MCVKYGSSDTFELIVGDFFYKFESAPVNHIDDTRGIFTLFTTCLLSPTKENITVIVTESFTK